MFMNFISFFFYYSSILIFMLALPGYLTFLYTYILRSSEQHDIQLTVTYKIIHNFFPICSLHARSFSFQHLPWKQTNSTCKYYFQLQHDSLSHLPLILTNGDAEPSSENWKQGIVIETSWFVDFNLKAWEFFFFEKNSCRCWRAMSDILHISKFVTPWLDVYTIDKEMDRKEEEIMKITCKPINCSETLYYYCITLMAWKPLEWLLVYVVFNRMMKFKWPSN